MILCLVYFYVRFPVSYRDLDEIMAERGADLDHATLNRWVEKYAGAIAAEAHRRKAPRIVRGGCLLGTLLCNALTGERRNLCKGHRPVDLFVPRDQQGREPLDSMLSKRRDEAAATALFVTAIGKNG